MFRRHAIGFRSLLMLVDGVLAAVLLAAVSVARFGTEWFTHWLPIIEQPAAFALIYAAGWVIVLDLHGLYRPRARWTIRSAAGASSGRSTRSSESSTRRSSTRSQSASPSASGTR